MLKIHPISSFAVLSSGWQHRTTKRADDGIDRGLDIGAEQAVIPSVRAIVL